MAQTESKSYNKFNSSSLKTEILLEFLRLGSKLFHSVIADGKNNF